MSTIYLSMIIMRFRTVFWEVLSLNGYTVQEASAVDGAKFGFRAAKTESRPLNSSSGFQSSTVAR